MRSAESDAARFYFALPRFVARFCGRNFERTENNWLEANIVGAAVMLVSYLAITHYLLRRAPPSKQLLLLLPVIVVTWLFWLLVLYINAQIIKLLRATGIISDLSNARAQSLLIGTVTTALAYYLVIAGGIVAMIGAIWIDALCVNLLAAALLARPRHQPNGG